MQKVFALTLLLLAAPASAQPIIPDTAMGKTLSDYLMAFNSGDSARMDAFKTAHHESRSVENTQRIFRQTGGFVLLKVETSDAESIVALAQEKESDRTLRVTIKEIGTADAPKLSVSLEGVSRPAEFAIPRMSQTEVIRGLDSRAAQLISQDRLSGAMLVARKGQIIYRRTWGQADRGPHTPVTLDTKFRLGSDNKMFTAVATLQLLAAGKLKLDGKLGDYLPDYPNKELAQKVTIRMLLTHSGGTGDFFGPEFDKNRLTLKHNEDYVTLFGDRAPAFEPGSKERYSNFGFILLGSIVQHVSGEDYYDYVRHHIFLPAGMQNTGSLPESAPVPNRAVGYMLKDGQWIDNADTLPWRGMAAGGGYSTVGDLLKFAQALENGKLLPKALKEQATDFQTTGKWYGYGFAVDGEGLTRWYGHGGGAPGMNAELRVFPNAGIVIVALANLDPPAATLLADYCANRMPLD